MQKWFGSIVFVCLFAGIASGATSDTPRAHEFIQAHGSAVDNSLIPEQRAIYYEYLRAAANPKAAVIKNKVYGPHARHRLDVFPPLQKTATLRPVIIFVHGGGFVSGNKGDGRIFDNVLDYFAARDVLGINVNYRLAPEFAWPAAVDDLREVLRWVRENAAEYGGDPERIFVMGHSAGAAHVAGYVFDDERQLEKGRDGVLGAILVSGTYGDGNLDSQHVYYGSDLAADSRRLPINNLTGRKIPLFVIDAEYDFPMMQRAAIDLIGRLCERDGQCPRHMQVPGHNHYSIMHHFNTADDSVAHEVAGFIRQWSNFAQEATEK